MRTLYIDDLASARKRMKEIHSPKTAILFLNFNYKPIAAWVPDGKAGGELFTQHQFKKRPLEMAHPNYGGRYDAWLILKAAALKQPFTLKNPFDAILEPE